MRALRWQSHVRALPDHRASGQLRLFWGRKQLGLTTGFFCCSQEVCFSLQDKAAWVCIGVERRAPVEASREPLQLYQGCEMRQLRQAVVGERQPCQVLRQCAQCDGRQAVLAQIKVPQAGVCVQICPQVTLR